MRGPTGNFAGKGGGASALRKLAAEMTAVLVHRGPLRGWAEELLSPEALGRYGLINPAAVRAAWREHLEDRRDWTHRLWIVLMLKAWRSAMV